MAVLRWSLDEIGIRYKLPLLNVATTTDGQTKVNGNETEWITVESKKAARQAKRIVSRTSSAETRNDHGNGEAKCKRVRFESE